MSSSKRSKSKRKRNPPPSLHQIALAQKLLIYAVVVYMTSWVLLVTQVVLIDKWPGFLWPLAWFSMGGIVLGGLGGIAALINLADVWRTGPGVRGALSIGFLVPIVGLSPLILTSDHANRLLRAGGVRVGFFGVSWADIRRLKAASLPKP